MSTIPARPASPTTGRWEMAARYDLGRLTDARRGADDGGASGHQFIDPDTVHVLSIGDRVDNVRLGDDADRLIAMGVQGHQAVAPACFIMSAAAAT
jgi:hypothetical protein